MPIRAILRTAALAATTIALAIGTNAPAHAAPSNPDSDPVVSALRERLTSSGISSEVQDSLVAKFLRGEMLDADTNAKPVKESTKTIDSKLVTRYVFADGSVATGTVEQGVTVSAGVVSPNSITGCSETVNVDVHTFRNCLVAWNAATWSMDYTADYDYYQFGSNIISLRGAHVGGIGSFSGLGTEIITAHANSSEIALGEGHAIQALTIFGVGVNRSIGIQLKVNTRWTPRKAQESSFGS